MEKQGGDRKEEGTGGNVEGLAGVAGIDLGQIRKHLTV